MLVRISKRCTYWSILGKNLERINLWSNIASSTSLTTKKTGKFQSIIEQLSTLYIIMHIAYNVFNINLFLEMKSLTETCHFKFILFIFFHMEFYMENFQFLSITRDFSSSLLSNIYRIRYDSIDRQIFLIFDVKKNI